MTDFIDRTTGLPGHCLRLAAAAVAVRGRLARADPSQPRPSLLPVHARRQRTIARRPSGAPVSRMSPSAASPPCAARGVQPISSTLGPCHRHPSPRSAAQAPLEEGEARPTRDARACAFSRRRPLLVVCRRLHSSPHYGGADQGATDSRTPSSLPARRYGASKSPSPTAAASSASPARPSPAPRACGARSPPRSRRARSPPNRPPPPSPAARSPTPTRPATRRRAKSARRARPPSGSWSSSPSARLPTPGRSNCASRGRSPSAGAPLLSTLTPSPRAGRRPASPKVECQRRPGGATRLAFCVRLL